MSNSQDWLVKFGFGGVQNFISSARKTRDLAASSLLVSEMAKSAGVFAQASGARLLRPSETSIPHWPHQIILCAEEFDSLRLRKLADGMGNAKDEIWQEILRQELRENVGSRIPKSISDQFPTIEKKDIASASPPIEHFWVAVPLNGPSHLREATQLLGEKYEQRKFTRTFSQLEKPAIENSDAWTCTLCGIQIAYFIPNDKVWPIDQWFLQGSEKLCLTCAAKRRWNANGRLNAIPSTHALARDRFAYRSEFQSLRDKLDEPVSEFLDNIDLLSQISEGRDKSVKVHEESRVAALLSDFQKLSKRELEQIRKLSPYFAIILFDGDEMGKWFSGTKFKPEVSAEQFGKSQNQLSQAVLNFSKAVDESGKEFRATVVYAGGDEGLIFCPLDFALSFVAKIRSLWEDVVAAVDANDCVDEILPTLSLQVVVGHAKSPLQPLVSAAHSELAASKSKADRNCFAIQVRPGSGAPSGVVLPWSDYDLFVSAIESFSNWRLMDGAVTGDLGFAQASLPSTLPYKVLACLDNYFDESKGNSLVLPTAFKRELNRMLSEEHLLDPALLPNWERMLVWLIERGTFNIDRQSLNGRDTVEGILKVTSAFARWLKTKETHVGV